MRTVKKGATSQSVYFDVLDSTSTTGGRKTGLVFNTSSLTAYYVRNQNTAAAITLVTLAAANTAWASGGFKEVDATNMPGIYRLDVPDAAFATGADSVAITLKGATGMVQASYDVQLVDNLAGDVYSRLGAPAGASIAADVAAVKVDTAAIKVQTDKVTFTVANQVDVNVLDWKSATAPAMTGDAYARIGAAGAGLTALGDTRIANLDAAVSTRSTPTNITAGTITTVTNLTNAPTSGDLTATMKASVTTAATAATPTIASVSGAVGSVTGNVGGNVTGSVGSVVGAVGSVTATVNADIKKVNGTTVNGDGAGTPWGP